MLTNDPRDQYTATTPEYHSLKTRVESLPDIIAGPILRRVDKDCVTIWLVTSQDCVIRAKLLCDGDVLDERRVDSEHKCCIQLGRRAWVHLVSLAPEDGVPEDVWLHYDVGIERDANHAQGTLWLHDLIPDISFPGEKHPRFVRKSQLDTVLHGSCRKPHHRGEDGFLAAESLLARARSGLTDQTENQDESRMHHASDDSAASDVRDTSEQPALLMLHGDQVYIDEVAGPMLLAIKEVIQILGLRDESIAGSDQVAAGSKLLEKNSHLYQRLQLLPDDPVNTSLIETVFRGANKPIFSSANADNHLITLAEVLAMYLLVWSPELWKLIQINRPEELSSENRERYDQESNSIDGFIESLPATRRVLANLPVYMIFDDHDITDDWNLSKAWQDRAYGHAFSRRIIGNAIIGYLICQGWGNNPSVFSPALIQRVRDSLAEDEPQAHDSLIDELLSFAQWDYVLNTKPPLIVMDARTRRWPSSISPVLPSGLLDKSGLDALKAELLGQKAVLLVSSAPIFGVKFIEVIQRIFAWCGMALMVDAENWMSHRGAAKGMLEIFQHSKTPETFVILSGDVHYSFAYDVRLRRPWRKPLQSQKDKNNNRYIQQSSQAQASTSEALAVPIRDDHAHPPVVQTTYPHIWQITSSGIKNRFPARLLRVFDRCNRWLYAGYSPLNLLTRRRRMHIRPRRPSPHEGRYRHQRLVNSTGIGVLRMDSSGQPVHICVRTTAGENIAFDDGYQSDWH